jgi:hypothetical protein
MPGAMPGECGERAATEDVVRRRRAKKAIEPIRRLA